VLVFLCILKPTRWRLHEILFIFARSFKLFCPYCETSIPASFHELLVLTAVLTIGAMHLFGWIIALRRGICCGAKPLLHAGSRRTLHMLPRLTAEMTSHVSLLYLPEPELCHHCRETQERRQSVLEQQTLPVPAFRFLAALRRRLSQQHLL